MMMRENMTENRMQCEEIQKKENRFQTELPICLTGTVIHGKALGRTVGMPTANLFVSKGTKLPKTGVYASRVQIGEKIFLGVTNVGTRPSVDNREEITIETLILDFERDIYGQEITLELCEYLRPIEKMESLKAVQLQVEKDSLRVRELFG